MTAAEIAAESARLQAEIDRLKAENAELERQIIADIRQQMLQRAAERRYADGWGFRVSRPKQQRQQPWPCGCRPYVDIFTRGRWAAQGHTVRPNEEPPLCVGKYARTPVFCRCQIEGARRISLEEMEARDAEPIPF